MPTSEKRSKILQYYCGEKPTDLMHDDAEHTGVVQTLQQPYTVTSFHLEPATQVAHNRHEPFLPTTDHSLTHPLSNTSTDSTAIFQSYQS